MTYPMSDIIIERGIDAMKSGRPTEARNIFETVLARDQQNIKAWWWLAQTCEAPKERSKCLENARQCAAESEDGLNIYRSLLEKSRAQTLPLYKVAAQSASKGHRCPICTCSLEIGEIIVICNHCKQAHHADCWRSNAYHCGNFACSNEGLIDYNGRVTTESPKKKTVISVKEDDIPIETPWLSREEQEAGFVNKLKNMVSNAIAQDFFSQLVQTVQREGRKQAQERHQAQIQRQINKQVLKTFLIGLVPGILMGISAFKYTHSWLIAMVTAFLIASSLSHAASITMKSRESFTGTIYSLLPKAICGITLITLFLLWGSLFWPIIISFLAAGIFTFILKIPALYSRRVPIVYGLLALLLFTLRVLGVF